MVRKITLWATADEAFAQFLATTLSPLCRICGSDPCYTLCSNHPDYYTPEREREDALWNDSLSYDQWFSLAAKQYELVHGEPYCS